MNTTTDLLSHGRHCAAAPARGASDTVARLTRRRFQHRSLLGLKVNLYTADEVEGLAGALEGDLADAPVECLMVGDSYFNTHLGRASTRLSPAEQSWGLDVLVHQVGEVRAAMDRFLAGEDMPLLMADMPDGTVVSPRAVVTAARRYVDAGADVVKVEVDSEMSLECVEALASSGIAVAAHLGYTPQHGTLGRRGESLTEALELFAAARSARDAGADVLVLEMVSEVVNRALSMPDSGGLPGYSVFSGAAPYGGQSLNVWDAVFRPAREYRYFPTTGTLDRDQDRDAYTPEVIGSHLALLIRQTLDGRFPLSPPTRLTPKDQHLLLTGSPWRAAAA
jgi:Ketopantoate hydroxymethyltransferase